MIKEMTGLPDGTLGFVLVGQIQGEDYDNVLVPAIDRAIEHYDRIKVLCQVGPGFEGYSMSAAWDDAKMGLRQWNGFERIAVATDNAWVRICVKAGGIVMPCPVELFEIDEIDEARRWLGESLGTIHLDQDGDVVTVRLLGKLEPSAYDGVDDDVSNLMSHSDHVRLMLDLREFDGWSGMAALGNHLSLVREHRRTPERVAVVGDKTWQKLAQKVMSKFINAETKFFDSGENNDAIAWVSA